MKHENLVLSNELIKVELFGKLTFIRATTVRKAKFALTKGSRTKRHFSKLYTVVTRLNPLIKPNFYSKLLSQTKTSQTFRCEKIFDHPSVLSSIREAIS